MEIFFNNEWLEVLGCGVVHQNIMKRSWPTPGAKGWAFGLGLERLAMVQRHSLQVLFQIPDVRLFWSEDRRFLEQFQGMKDKPIHFKPYSKNPPCYKDITFWLPPNWRENDFFDIVRKHASETIENVSVIDEFLHPKTQRTVYLH